MLEMFVLNPQRGGKIRTRRIRRTRRAARKASRKSSVWSKLVKKHGVKGALKVRRSRRRGARKALRARRLKLAAKSKPTIKRRRHKKYSDNPKVRRKSMAVRTRRRRKAGRRRFRRNSWPRQSKDHAVAAKLGWAYQERRRKRKRGSPRSYILSSIRKRRLQKYRARHKVAKRRKSAGRMLSFRMPIFGKTYRLVANKKGRGRRSRRRFMDNGRRRRRSVSRGAKGRFVSNKRRGSRRRRYAKNFYPFNDNKPRRRRRKAARKGRRRSYKKNWFVYNDNSPKRRRKARRSGRRSRRRYSDNGRRRYMRNNAVADVMDTVKSVFDVSFLQNTALPVVGGFFASRAISGFAGAGLLGASYTGWVAHLGNLVSAGLAGAAVGMIFKNPQLAGNVVLGGVVNAVTNIVRDLAGTYGGSLVSASPVLKTALGLSGMGDNLRQQVEAEVMRELGVSDFLTSQQLSRSERVGDYLTSQQLSRSERVGQYPAETSGISQYPAETSGGAMADMADMATFG